MEAEHAVDAGAAGVGEDIGGGECLGDRPCERVGEGCGGTDWLRGVHAQIPTFLNAKIP